jgi:SepF-like predicted cell division protein (DUF552 family)
VAESVRKKTATEAAVAKALNPPEPPQGDATPDLEQLAAMLGQGQQGAPGVADTERLKHENAQLAAMLDQLRGGQNPHGATGVADTERLKHENAQLAAMLEQMRGGQDPHGAPGVADTERLKHENAQLAAMLDQLRGQGQHPSV